MPAHHPVGNIRVQQSGSFSLGSAIARRGDVRERLARAVRHVVRSLRPVETRLGAPVARMFPSAVLPQPSEARQAPDPRLRAREVLAEARAQMPSLLEEEPAADAAGQAEVVPAESAVLRRALRSYTDHVARLLAAAEEERRLLREQVNRLSEELLLLRAEVIELRAALPGGAAQHARPFLSEPVPGGVVEAARDAAEHASGAAEEVDAPEEQEGPGPSVEAWAGLQASAAGAGATQDGAEAGASEARMAEDPALESRVFPAGSIGVLLALRPRQRPRHVESICHRLAEESLVEQVVETPGSDDETRLRVGFYQPVRWSWLREALERAAGATIHPAIATFDGGVLRLRLRAPQRPSVDGTA